MNQHNSRQYKSGFTLLELIVSISIVALLLSIGLMAVQRVRAASRANQCRSQLKQIGLAVQLYHSAFRMLPMHGGGTAEANGHRTRPVDQSNHHRLSYAVGILPFVEQQSLWETISSPYATKSIASNYRVFPPMGPVPWFNELGSEAGGPKDLNDHYSAWQRCPSILKCPSDPTSSELDAAGTNYAACMGDGIDQLGFAFGRPQHRFQDDVEPVRGDDSTKRGMFANWHSFRWSDCTDGLANTLLVGEIVRYDGTRDGLGAVATRIDDLPRIPYRCTGVLLDGRVREEFRIEERGSRWADAGPTFSGFSTVLAPNSPSCTQRTHWPVYSNWYGGIFSASSRHAGGIHVVFCDGSVHFITETIDARTAQTEGSSIYAQNVSNPPGSGSPFGVWGAMGTRGSGEVADE